MEKCIAVFVDEDIFWIKLLTFSFQIKFLTHQTNQAIESFYKTIFPQNSKNDLKSSQTKQFYCSFIPLILQIFSNSSNSQAFSLWTVLAPLRWIRDELEICLVVRDRFDLAICINDGNYRTFLFLWLINVSVVFSRNSAFFNIIHGVLLSVFTYFVTIKLLMCCVISQTRQQARY